MLIHTVGQRRHFIDDLRQRGGVAVGELADAAGEGLGDAVQLALHGGGEAGQPFVVHHQGLDLGLAELWVVVVSEGIELRCLRPDGLFQRGLFGIERGPLLEYQQFFCSIRVFADLADAIFHCGEVDLVKAGECRIFAAVFLL